LEELLETLFTDTYTVDIDLNTKENGNIERTLTIVTTETIEVAEEPPIQEEVEEESDNGNGGGGSDNEDPEPEPEPKPEPEPEPPKSEVDPPGSMFG
jgi:hypothetical protein